MKKKELLDIALSLIYLQFFKKGFVHGDPHPSNLIFRENSQMVLIDFGIVGRLSEKTRVMFESLVKAIATKNSNELFQILISVDQKEGVRDNRVLRETVEDMVEKFETTAVGEASPTELFLEFLWKATTLDIQFPRYFILFGKVLAIYDAYMQKIDSSVTLMEYFTKLFEKDTLNFQSKAFSKIKQLPIDIYSSFENLYSSLVSTPEELTKFLNEIKDNGIPIRVYNSPLKESEADIEDSKKEPNLFIFGFLFSLLSLVAVFSLILFTDLVFVFILTFVIFTFSINMAIYIYTSLRK